MEDKLISFKVAKLAKEKGFHIPCENYYVEYIDDDIADLFNYEEQRGSCFAELYRNNKEFKFSAPTQSLLQKFLREIHDIHLTVTSISQESWQCHITKKGDDLEKNYTENHYDYEEALEVGLYKSLKLIK